MKEIVSISMVSALVLASAGLLLAGKSNRDNENKNVICHTTGAVLDETRRAVIYNGVVVAHSDNALAAHLAHGDRDIRDTRVEQGPGDCRIRVPLPE